MDYKLLLEKFQLDSPPVKWEPHGNGNINSTMVVTTESGRRYILQKINEEAFKDVPALMENISKVTDFLAKKAKEAGEKAPVLAQVKTIDGESYVKEEDGYFRVAPFAENTISLETPESDEDFYECAVAFGTFISKLGDYPAENLHETIPNFHNTPDRYRIFHEKLEAAKQDPDLSKRVEEAKAEIQFALHREESAGILQSMRDKGELPTRVTHNDTKLNNVLLNADTRKLEYVIDLDTVMPGLAHYDYGDCIRFGASTGGEDEKDLSKIHCDMHLFEVFTDGFISACEGLTQKEIETLPLGAKTITLELAVRFLTDYLDGDKYFLTKYPGHNLDRCRTQMKLVSDMEEKWDEMQNVIARATNRR
ncbi:MAG: aminoglycoside phosphotransferase family protein [Bacillota bacterium]|nr:aminoglycoside phosphotransferase family protein [Bacillota bacterium]